MSETVNQESVTKEVEIKTFTQEEVNGIELDGAFDVKRLNAYEAINTLNY